MPTINGKACVANGRNLLTGTGNHTVTGTGAIVQGYLSNETTYDLLNLFKGLEGQTVTISVDYEYSGFVANSGSSFNRLGWEMSIITGAKPYLDIWYLSAWYDPNNDSGSGRISSTIVVPKNITGIEEGMGYIEFPGSGTGTVSHLKLEKGITATPLTPAPVDKVFSNGKQVYGRNLLKGTFTSSFPNGANGTGTTISLIDGDDGEKYLHVVSALNGAGMYIGAYQLSSIMLPFKKYTVSADIKGDGAISFGFELVKSPVATLTSDWKRYSVSYEFGDIIESIIWYGIANFYIRLVKLEEGTIATPWTPAPEDVM